MIVFGSPSRYYQGPGCFDRIGDLVRPLASTVTAVVDAFVLTLLRDRLEESLRKAAVSAQILPFSGDVMRAAIDSLVGAVASGPFGARVDAVVAIGGGKAIDVGKGLAHRLARPVVTVPTAAANDAPTSKNYVVYDEHHVLVEVAHLPANPAAVIADTAIIAGAPRILLASGVGDGLTKAFEAAQCYAVQGRTMFGERPSLSALTLAQASYRILREHAVESLAIAGASAPTPAFEKLIEAMFLMGGLGFESGGLSVAHAMTRGLSHVPEVARAMHGQQVAYGLLVQLALEGRDEAFMADLCSFYETVGLARTLAELGVDTPDESVFHAIARPSLAAPHTKNFTRPLTEDDFLSAMRRTEQAGARVRPSAGVSR